MHWKYAKRLRKKGEWGLSWVRRLGTFVIVIRAFGWFSGRRVFFPSGSCDPREVGSDVYIARLLNMSQGSKALTLYHKRKLYYELKRQKEKDAVENGTLGRVEEI
ncbi:unnamed protein product [Somion occarium]|uniref:Uncharacterized protein n=1 Tax=Somion occarium TaxID=3059160 RepID=A0ABP1E702_9APHY